MIFVVVYILKATLTSLIYEGHCWICEHLIKLTIVHTYIIIGTSSSGRGKVFLFHPKGAFKSFPVFLKAISFSSFVAIISLLVAILGQSVSLNLHLLILTTLIHLPL